MKRTCLIALMCSTLLALSAGCSWSPQKQFIAANDSFVGVVNTLAVLKDADTFNEREIEQITIYVYAGQRLLDRWQAELELDGEDRVYTHLDAYRAFSAELQVILRELLAARIAAERSRTTRAPGDLQ